MHKTEIEYMSSSSKPASRSSSRTKLNSPSTTPDSTGNIMESSASSSASFGSAEDISFGSGSADREGAAVPQIRLTQHPATGTDASGELRFRPGASGGGVTHKA